MCANPGRQDTDRGNWEDLDGKSHGSVWGGQGKRREEKRGARGRKPGSAENRESHQTNTN